jgi:hypothetical protein
MSGAILSHPSTNGSGTPNTVFQLRDMGQVSSVLFAFRLAYELSRLTVSSGSLYSNLHSRH